MPVVETNVINDASLEKIKILQNLVRCVLKRIQKLWGWLTSRISDVGEDKAEYVDLAPTDKADKSKIYTGALIEAIQNPNVFNIALTGPYGSGKSSIIKSFLRRYKKCGFWRKPVLQISLAAFLSEADAVGGHVSKQEIERSILQQMLYGADSNSLPLSRFKRIQSPKWWSRFVCCWSLSG